MGKGEQVREGSGRSGVRERSKKERRERILFAARKLFSEQGYDATTLRQIAASAGLGLATLFNYISDKRDLIYLIFEEEMDALTVKALSAPKPWQTFLEKMLTITELHYRFFAQDPMLSRILMNEVLLESPGLNLERYRLIRERTLRGIEALILEAQHTGEVTLHENSDLIARQIFYTFTCAVLSWLTAPQPVWRDGQREMERMLRLQTHGFASAIESARPTQPGHNGLQAFAGVK